MSKELKSGIKIYTVSPLCKISWLKLVVKNFRIF